MLKKLTALFATGAPGLSRLLFATILGIVFGSENSVNVLTDFAFVIGLSMVLSQGFSLLLLKAQNEDKELQTLLGSYLSIFPAVIILFSIYQAGVLHYFIPSLTLFCGLVGYQNLRHKWIRQQLFKSAVVAEVLLLIGFLIGSLVLFYLDSITPKSMYVLFSSLLVCFSLFEVFKLCAQQITFSGFGNILSQALYIGASNFLTGGVIWVMPKVSEYLFLPHQVVIISSLSFLLGLITLLPRTYLNLQLEKLNNAVELRSRTTIDKINNNLKWVLLFLLPLITVLTTLYSFFTMSKFEAFWQEVLLINLFASLVLLVSQKNLITSTVMTLLHKNEFTLKFNAVYFSLLTVSVIVFALLKELNGSNEIFVYCFYIVMLLSIVVRNYLLESQMKREFRLL